jgi:hypothetical protein
VEIALRQMVRVGIRHELGSVEGLVPLEARHVVEQGVEAAAEDVGIN